MDDKIFGSMMQSSRRFSEIEIEVNSRPGNGEHQAERIVALVEKFKLETKRLIVSKFPECSDEVFSKLLEAATDLEVLQLVEDYSSRDRKYLFKKEFSKLKLLTLRSSQEITGILNRVPDNSLEGFTVWPRFSNVLKEEFYQAFLNRQTKLKQLVVLKGANPNIEHLAVNHLRFCARNDHQVASFLKNQNSLRRLVIVSEGIDKGSAAVSETVELKNLRELGVVLSTDGNGFILRQVVFPDLLKITLDVWPMEFERFSALSRDLKKSAQSVRDIEIKIRTTLINFVPAIIELFPALKTLLVEASWYGVYDKLAQPVISRPNQNLEELIVRKYDVSDRALTSFFDAINACPSLKRNQLDSVRFSDQQVLDVIRNHSRLTHFWFSFSRREAFADHTEASLDPRLLQIINIFRNSADFVCLSLVHIRDWENRSLEDLLAEDADRIIVSKPMVHFGTSLTLKKKTAALDPFENFHKKQITNLL